MWGKCSHIDRQIDTHTQTVISLTKLSHPPLPNLYRLPSLSSSPLIISNMLGLCCRLDNLISWLCYLHTHTHSPPTTHTHSHFLNHKLRLRPAVTHTHTYTHTYVYTHTKCGSPCWGLSPTVPTLLAQTCWPHKEHAFQRPPQTHCYCPDSNYSLIPTQFTIIPSSTCQGPPQNMYSYVYV